MKKKKNINYKAKPTIEWKMRKGRLQEKKRNWNAIQIYEKNSI